MCAPLVSKNVEVLQKKSLSSLLSNEGDSKPKGLIVVTGHTVRDDPAFISGETEYFMEQMRAIQNTT